MHSLSHGISQPMSVGLVEICRASAVAGILGSKSLIVASRAKHSIIGRCRQPGRILVAHDQ